VAGGGFGMGVNKTSAIEEFNRIRDKPYYVDVNDDNFGCNCYTKAIELQPILEDLGYQTRIMVCYFDWRQPPFLQEMLKFYDHNQETTHTWLQVRETDAQEWQDVDPSWDTPLAKLGFQIAEWNGHGCTAMSVYPTYRMSYEEGQEYLAKSASDKAEDARYRLENKDFFSLLRDWMESGRNG
jgi:arylamine N-acetyltransferase